MGKPKGRKSHDTVPLTRTKKKSSILKLFMFLYCAKKKNCAYFPESREKCLPIKMSSLLLLLCCHI
jgi:hypothetical protein